MFLRNNVEEPNPFDTLSTVQLFSNYEKKKEKSIFDKPIENRREYFLDYVRTTINILIDEGILDSRKSLRAMDTIDYTPMIQNQKGEESSLLPIKFTEDEENIFCEKWFFIIPPLKDGVLRINKNRFIKFHVVDILEEEKAYEVVLMDYACDKVWTLENHIESTVYWRGRKETGGVHVSHATKGLRLAEYFRVLDKDNVVRWNNYNEQLFLNEVVYPYLKGVEKDCDTEDCINSFISAIMRTNYQLSQGRPRAKRGGKGPKVKNVYEESEKNPKPQIIRTLSGGIEVTSVKPPRIVEGKVLRHYKIATWKTRGHIRRYKTGKEVYIRPSIHHRKCMNQDGVNAAQTIIQLSVMNKHK